MAGKWAAENKSWTAGKQQQSWKDWQNTEGGDTDKWKEQDNWKWTGNEKWDGETWSNWNNDKEENWKASGGGATRQDEGRGSKLKASADAQSTVDADNIEGEKNGDEYSQNFKADEPECENDGHEKILDVYIKTLPHDSFSCLRLHYDTETHGDEIKAQLWLPVACPIRSEFSKTAKTHLSAKRQAGKLAVEELKAQGQLDENYQPVKVEAVPVPGDLQWPHMPPGQMPLEVLAISKLQGVAEWPTAMVLTKITLTPEQPGWPSFGTLSARASPAERPGFAMQFELGEGRPVARIEPAVISWPPSAGATAHIQAYNRKILPDGPDTVMVVPLTRDSIDWDRICGVSSKGKEETGSDRLSEWLLPLCQRIASLQRLEQLGRLAPIGPVPNPLRMEAVLGAGFGEGGPAFKALSLQGRAVLKMLFSVALFVERPFDDARRLEERVQAATTPERLAYLIAKSGLLAEVLDAVEADWIPRLSGVDVEVAEQMLTALVGAYVGEKGGDFYSVVKLWEWLTDEDELRTAVRYLDCATTEYRGRTPTYENFKQVEAEDGTLELHVYYGGGGTSADLGEVRYRRPNVSNQMAYGQYWLLRDQENGQAQWCNVQYDHRQATYVWTAFQVTDAYNNPMPAALPNKVQRWLRGTPASALINYKRCSGPTLVHDALREMKDGSLRVLYKTRGWFTYKRCPKGGLGFEAPHQTDALAEQKPVLYSEKPGEKTLFSPNFEQEPLPNKVTEWLMTGKSLYQLVSIVSSTGQAEDVKVEEQDSDHISWECSEGKHWKCCRYHAGCAIVFIAGFDGQLDELMYQGQSCTTFDKVPMPEKVIKWLKKHPDRSCDEKVFKAYVEQQKDREKTMCTPAPLQMQAWFPQLSFIDLGHLEKALQHAFSNRMLLAEALLQSSGKADNMTSDCQRLAVVGNAVAEQLVTRILVESATFSTAATLSSHDKVSDTEKDPSKGTFAVGPNASLQTTNSPTYQWPEARGGLTFGAEWPIIEGIDVSTPEKLCKWRDACCNNVAYARTCVELGLHKGMLQGSPELSRSVRAFAKVVERTREEYEKTGENPWPRLLQHDAPRALGNTFIACLGATVMDGAQGVQSYSYLDAKKVLVKHVEDCRNMPITNCTSSSPDEITLENIKRLKESRTLNYTALGPPSMCIPCGTPEPTPVLTLPPHATEAEQVQKALELTDVHFRYVDDNMVDARSPRTACLRAPYVDVDVSSDEQDEEQTTEEDGTEPNVIDNGAAKYCEDCEMWLNGPTQWEDHKIGKKHKKNVKKGGANKAAAVATPIKAKTAAKAKPGSTPPPPPQEDPSGWPQDESKAPTMNDTNAMAAYGGYAPHPPPQMGYPFYPYPPFPQYMPYMYPPEAAYPAMAPWPQAEQPVYQAEAEPSSDTFQHQ